MKLHCLVDNFSYIPANPNSNLVFLETRMINLINFRKAFDTVDADLWSSSNSKNSESNLLLFSRYSTRSPTRLDSWTAIFSYLHKWSCVLHNYNRYQVIRRWHDIYYWGICPSVLHIKVQESSIASRWMVWSKTLIKLIKL